MNDRPRVAPVRRYRVARYPSHRDPDPLRDPPLPYPFAPRLIAAVAAGGLASGWQACAAAEGEGNPLALTQSGLPHQSSPYGTGAPDYLDAEVARQVVRRLMEEAGYQMQADVAYDRDGVSLRLDGYDAEKKVGFVFADYTGLEADALLSWQDSVESLDEWADGMATGKAPVDDATFTFIALARAEPQAEARRLRLVEARSVCRLLSNTADACRRLDLSPEERTDAERFAALPPGQERIEHLLSLLATRRARLVSLREMQELEQRALRDREFIAVISQFDQRFLYHSRRAWDDAALAAIEKLPEAEREAERRRLTMEDAAEALTNLETAVRDYLAWARTQGLP